MGRGSKEFSNNGTGRDMNLFDQFEKGKELIRNGKTLGKNVKTLEEQVNGLEEILKRDIEQMKLSEIENRDIAIQIYSEVLCCNLWLCSNNGMAAQIRRDDPEVVTYTVDELRELLHLNPNPDDLLAIHNAKSVFLGSRVIESNLKKKNEEKKIEYPT